MDVSKLITGRHAKRAFLSRKVERELLAEVLRDAAHAPSSRNIQPWAVEVVLGPARDALAERLLAAFDADAPAAPEFKNNPAELEGVFAERAKVAGAGVFEAKGIGRDDAAARRAHIRDNFDFYGAPAVLFFHLDRGALDVHGSFLALGFFVQNVMLGLVGRGLGSCPQYSIVRYPNILRDFFGLDADRLMVCGLCVGHPDPDAPVNTFAPERAALDEYVRWHSES